MALQTRSVMVQTPPRGNDREFETNPATRRLRRVVWNTFYKYFHPGDSVLDLNCGSGRDALELASSGIRVLAADSSEDMVASVHRKLYGTALRSFVTPVHLSVHRLYTLDGRTFDGAYSNLGGLNYTSRLNQVSQDLGRLVKRGGHLVLCMMSDFSLWESASFLLRGRWNKVFKRREPYGALAEVQGQKVWVHYYSPQRVKELFRSHFEFVGIRGMNFLSPPASAPTAQRLLGKGQELLNALEDKIPAQSALHGWGAYYVIVFRRKTG